MSTFALRSFQKFLTLFLNWLSLRMAIVAFLLVPPPRPTPSDFTLGLKQQLCSASVCSNFLPNPQVDAVRQDFVLETSIKLTRC